MDTIEFFKQQAKNLMRDWNTHQDDEELGYVYTPRFFDIDGILLAFDEDEKSFCLQRAQHLIAKLAGFRKWNDLIVASSDELRLAKIVFEGCKASDDICSASEDWQMYLDSFDSDELSASDLIPIAKRYFSISDGESANVTEEGEKKAENKTPTVLTDEGSRLLVIRDSFQPMIEQLNRVADSMKPFYAEVESISRKANEYVDGLSEALRKSYEPLKEQIDKWTNETAKICKQLTKVLDGYGKPLEEVCNYFKINSNFNYFSEAVKSSRMFDSFFQETQRMVEQIKPTMLSLKPLIDQEAIVQKQLKAFIEKETDFQKLMGVELEKRNIMVPLVPSKKQKNEEVQQKESTVMAKKEIRAEYWKFAESAIRNSVPEVFGTATLHEARSAFDGVSRKGVPQLTCIARTEKPVQISVGVYFKNNDADLNRRIFDFVYERKDEILARLPFKDVTIEPAEGTGRQPNGERLHYNLLVTSDLSVLDRNNWDACKEFHSKVARVLYDYVIVELGPEIQALNNN